MSIVKKLRRICKRCNKLFTPNSKFHRVCTECKTKNHISSFKIKKIKLFKLKQLIKEGKIKPCYKLS